MNGLASKYPEEIQRIIAKYPAGQKRSAVMPLLHLAQREAGFISKQAVVDIADLLDMTTTDVVTIIGYYTLYHDQPEGKFRFQICNDLPCALRGADHFLEELCKALGIQPGETTPDGLITVETVACLAACDKAPMFQVQAGDEISYHERQTVESALKLVEELRKKAGEVSA
jgi:NADH-quinone oxidoreductase subunit E